MCNVSFNFYSGFRILSSNLSKLFSPTTVAYPLFLVLNSLDDLSLCIMIGFSGVCTHVSPASGSPLSDA